MSRRKQREHALQALYAIEVGKGDAYSTRDLLYSLIKGDYRESFFSNTHDDERLPFQYLEKYLNNPGSKIDIYSTFFGQLCYIEGQKLSIIRILFTIEHIFSIYFSIFWEHLQEDRILTIQLIEGVVEKGGYIDSIIEKYSTNWSLDRISIVDRNIMRMAIYELIYITNIPYNVTANEAVELAKKFGSEKSSRFINGILGKIIEDIIEGELLT